MLNSLYTYINNPNDPEINFQLAQEYDAMGQTASALGFYLRCAERSTDDQQQYTALLHCALCFERQRCREGTEKTLLLKAIALLPTRPEAYFLLSRLHEILKEWQESYTMSCLGLKLCDLSVPEDAAVEYPGPFALLFQKGVAAWWVGHCEESREIMEELKFHYPLNDFFMQLVNNNLASIGYPNTTIVYTGAMADQLRYQFLGADTIDKNYSQSLQDMFVLSATGGLRGGTYVEIGSAEPFYNNNTALLEKHFGWTGISIDIDRAKVTDFNNKRNNPALCLDATATDYVKLFQQSQLPDIIDYLQIDCDPPEISFKILQSIPFNQYQFKVITFEHDVYYNATVRDQSRDFLLACGYQLVAGDIAYNQKNSYEDWWCRPDLIDPTVLEKLKDNTLGVKFAGNYMLPPPAEPAEQTLLTPVAIVNKDRTVVRSDSELINRDYMNGFWVVDNFYRDPDAVREFALQQEYEPSGPGKPYIGSRTYKQFLFPGLKEEFEYIMGKKITAWESHGMNGRFQFNIEGEPLVYHADDQQWAAMLYLTPGAPYESGTMTHALKGTGIRHTSHPDVGRCFRPGSRNLDKTPYEDVDIIGNVYNRLFIFNAGYLHSACAYFGWTKENSRLWQMFFFD